MADFVSIYISVQFGNANLCSRYINAVIIGFHGGISVAIILDFPFNCCQRGICRSDILESYLHRGVPVDLDSLGWKIKVFHLYGFHRHNDACLRIAG